MNSSSPIFFRENLFYPNPEEIEKTLKKKLEDNLPVHQSLNIELREVISKIASLHLFGKPRLPHQANLTSNFVIALFNTTEVSSNQPDIQTFFRECTLQNCGDPELQRRNNNPAALIEEKVELVKKLKEITKTVLTNSSGEIEEFFHAIKDSIHELNDHSTSYQTMRRNIKRKATTFLPQPIAINQNSSFNKNPDDSMENVDYISHIRKIEREKERPYKTPDLQHQINNDKNKKTKEENQKYEKKNGYLKPLKSPPLFQDLYEEHGPQKINSSNPFESNREKPSAGAQTSSIVTDIENGV